MKFKVIICFFCIIAGCTKKESATFAAIDSTYVVSGKILDAQGNGVPHVRVTVANSPDIYTDPSGNWISTQLKGEKIIGPADSQFLFTPSSITINSLRSNLLFVASDASSPSPLTGNILAWFTSMQLPNGLLESTEHSNQVSLYDNALAALVFISQGKHRQAEAIFDFFNQRLDSEFRIGSGGFAQFRNSSGAPSGNRWLGDNAWLLIALNNYALQVNPTKYQDLSLAINHWIRGLQDIDGGILGGTAQDGSAIGKVTEGNIDAFNAVGGYDSFHQKMLKYLQSTLWDTSEKLLIAWPGNKYKYALDNHSWGYCSFEDFPYAVLEKTDRYVNTRSATVNGLSITGFAPDIDKDAVWLEGTGQMIVAFQKAGKTDLANKYLDEMKKLVFSSPGYPGSLGLPYASNPGTTYGADPLWVGADTKLCISSSAWFLFAVSHFDPMKAGFTKKIPAEDKFWTK